MSSAGLLAAQGVGVAGLVFGGQWLVARFAKQAAFKATEAQEEANAVTGFHQLVTDLQADMARLRADHNDLSAKHAELGRHVEQLERERRRDKSLIRHLVAYVRILCDSLRAARLPVPEAPAGLDVDGGPLA